MIIVLTSIIITNDANNEHVYILKVIRQCWLTERVKMDGRKGIYEDDDDDDDTEGKWWNENNGDNDDDEKLMWLFYVVMLGC